MSSTAKRCAETMNPFDLPIHPAVVHFPIAMLTAAWLCVLFRHASNDAVWEERSRLFEAIGVLTLPITIAAGFVDLRGLGPLTETRWDQPLIWHVLTASAGSVVFTTHYLTTRRATPSSSIPAVADVGLSTLALWLIVFSGLLAAEMVYGA